MYTNYTAKVQEVLAVGTITTTIDPVVFDRRLEEVLNERLALIAEATNATGLSGVVVIIQPGGRRLQVQTLDTSSCDPNAMQVSIEIIMEAATLAERTRFIDLFDNSVLPGIIQNITGSGDVAGVCAAAAVTELSRATADAPPPPPDLGLTIPDSDPIPRTVWVIAIVASGLILSLGCLCAWYYFGGVRRREEEEEEDSTKAQLKKAISLGNEPAETSSFFGEAKRGTTSPRKHGVGNFVLDREGGQQT